MILKKIGLVMLAMLLVFGLTIVGCNKSRRSRTVTTSKRTVPATSGRLTITNLDGLDGFYITALGGRNVTNLYAVADITADGNITYVPIKNGSATLKVWSADKDLDSGNLSLSSYTAKASNLILSVFIFDSANAPFKSNIGEGIITVSFVNGIGTTSINIETDGKLTITGLDDYNDEYVYAFTNDMEFFHNFKSNGFFAGNRLTCLDNRYTAKIVNGSVSLKVWSAYINEYTDSYALGSYKENDKDVTFRVKVVNSSYVTNNDKDNPRAKGTVIVNFTNGVGSAKFPTILTPETDGKLTVNNLGKYNGKFFAAKGYTDGRSSIYLVAAADVSGQDWTLCEIKNGSVNLNVWEIYGYSRISYKGDHSITMEFTIRAEEGGGPQFAQGTVTVEFKNGIGTVTGINFINN